MSQRTPFQEMSNQDRLDRLTPSQKRSLAWAIMDYKTQHPDKTDVEMTQFYLPLVELGLDFQQIRALSEKIPPHYPIDHRHIYFDFRLARWMRVLEPPTLRECLEDYLESAPAPKEAMDFIRGECRDFFSTHAQSDWTMAPHAIREEKLAR